jgi:alkaline phosphatase
MAALAVTMLVAAAVMAIPLAMSGEAQMTSCGNAKNVIMMIPDGMSTTQYTLARWYNNASLALDEMPSGLVRTYGAESIITDSAPAATAFATGYKTSDKYVGILPGPVTIPGVPVPSAHDQYKPVASILEAAKLKGMSVGLIATSNIQHATPAGFSAHWADRGNYNEIAEQQVYEDIDVLFGGGSDYMKPTSEGGKRTDGENLVSVLESRGYSYITTRDQMMSLSESQSKVWGLFAGNAMAHDFDRNLHPEQPSLAEMTDKAIDILSKNPKGFFLMVEGSQVDWSSHANDPIGVISETLAFDDAVKVALDFAKEDRRTMIMAFTDHGNGGMTIGNTASDATYSKMPLSSVLDPLKKASQTGYALMEILGTNVSAENVLLQVKTYYGLDLTADEVNTIVAAYNPTTGKWTKDLDYILGPMMSKRAYIGWTTTGHTGEDVTLYSYGPRAPYGLLDNTELATTAARAIGADLGNVNRLLYAESTSAFAAIGMTVSIDSTDPANKVLVVMKGSTEKGRLPFSTDILYKNGVEYHLSGLTIFAEKSGKVYVPMDAVKMIKDGSGHSWTMSSYAQAEMALA